MDNTSQVAHFVASRIQITGKLQKDIAREAGFDKPNMITMIKQGRTRLPLDKVGTMALALETEPVSLLQMCLKEYHPETWKAIAPFMESASTEDEVQLLRTLRNWIGGPYLAALSAIQKDAFDKFLVTLKEPMNTTSGCH